MVGRQEECGGMRGRVWWDRRKRVEGYEEDRGGMRGRVWWDER